LFDAVASLIGLRDRVSFEGQAAMQLEFAAAAAADARDSYAYVIRDGGPFVIDWEPMIREIIKDTRDSAPTGVIAAKFHNTLAEIIVDVARRVGQPKVLLTGGCFQNRYLTEGTVRRLEDAGFSPYWHQRVPPNDGGLSLGQIVAAERRQNVAPGVSPGSAIATCISAGGAKDLVESSAPSGLNIKSTEIPGLRPGLHSDAAPRLQF
jgi:hydrogenase maturation protein HypF